MPHLQLALLEELAHLRCKLEQAQQIADAGARAPHRLGRLLMGNPELTDQALERTGLLEGI